MRKLFPIAILAALLLTGCSGITISETPVGPTQTATINVPAPDSDAANLTLRFGASNRFELRPGAAGLAEGAVLYNVEQLKPIVTTTSAGTTIEQRANNLNLSTQVRNEWDLKLSDSIPIALTIEAGAFKGAADLGGLRLRSLSVSQGAADSSYDFSKPNPEAMDMLSFKSGAANLKVKNLANANAASMNFDTAAGDYTLDFGGTLARSANVQVKSAASNLTISVPRGTPMRVTLTSELSKANLTNFTDAGDKQYINESWDESQPHVDVTVDSAVGAVNLESK